MPMIHSKMAARPRRTGPVKKKIPTTPARLLVPAKPIKIIEKVKVEMTKPVKPMGTALAKRLTLLPWRGVLGVRYSFSNSSGEMVMPLWEEVMLRLWLCDFSKTASAEGLFTSVAVDDIFCQLTSRS